MVKQILGLIKYLCDSVPLLDDKAVLPTTQEVDLKIAGIALVSGTESQWELDNAVCVAKLISQRNLWPPIAIRVSPDSFGWPNGTKVRAYTTKTFMIKHFTCQ